MIPQLKKLLEKINKKISSPKTFKKKISKLLNQLKSLVLKHKIKLISLGILVLTGLFVLRFFGTYFIPPKIATSFPDNSSQDVPLQTTISIRFNKPMLKQSVIQSISVNPDLQGSWQWESNRKITFQPEQKLKRGQVYQISFKKLFFSKYLIPGFKKPTITFTTVGHPTVALATPKTEAPGLKTPITVVFDREMQPLTTTAEKKEFKPAFQLQPAVKGTGKWLGTTAYQFRPQEKMQPATTYTYTISKGLPSQDGGAVQKNLKFEFSTPKPRVLKTTPENEYEYADPTASVAAQFNLPISLQSAQEKFHLYQLKNGKKKEIKGHVLFKNNFIGFHPQSGLKRNKKYQAVIKSGLKTTKGPNPTEKDYSWKFQTASSPKVISTDPEQNAEKVFEKHKISFGFASPMDEDSFENNILISPKPEKEPYVYFRSYRNNNRLEVSTYLKRNTDYQITLTTGIKDQHGVPLQKNYTLNFQTAHYKPAISIEPENTYFASFNQKYIPRIVTKVVNTKKVNFNLYKLDKESFYDLYDRRYNYYNDYKNRDWQNYDPKHLKRIHQWSETFQADQNQAVNVITKVKQKNGEKLDNGLYFLDAKIKDKIHDNLVMVVSNLSLNLKTSDNQALAWGVDLNTGKPVKNLKVNLTKGYKYKFVNGKTNQDGIYQVKDKPQLMEPDRDSPIWAFAEKDQYWGVVNNNWGEGIEPYDFNIQRYWDSQIDTGDQEFTMHLQLDRPIYRPGQTVHFKGIVRRYEKNNYIVPQKDLQVKLTHYDSENNIMETRSYNLNANGTFSDKLQLGEDVGYHRLEVSYQDNSFQQKFQVEEYKKPDFQVNVSTSKNNYINHQTLNTTIKADYYFGAPLKNADIKWTLSTWDYPFKWEQNPRFSFGNNESIWTSPWWISSSYGYSKLITEGTGKTNNQGEYQVQIPLNIDDRETTQKMRLEAVVTDKNEQVIANSKTFSVHHGQLHIGLKPQTYSGSPGEERKIKLAAVDINGEKQPQVPISVSLYKRTWNTIKEKNPDTGRFYWRSKPKDKLITTKRTTTDELGRAVASFKPEEGGFYHVVAENKQTVPSSTNFWVSGSGLDLPENNHDRIPLVPDKYEYQVGEKANFQPGLEYSKATGLVTIERENIVDYKIIHLTEEKQNFSINLTDKHIPNTYVSGLFIKPAQGLKKPAQMKMGVSEIRVNNPDLKTNIAINTNKKEYQPKETVKIDLKTTNQNQQPTSSEISLALVDQSVWDLSTIDMPDPYKIFYRPRNLSVYTSSDLSKSMDRINANTKLGSKGGSGGGCFGGDTPVLMADGTYKPIRDISPGDYILTRKSSTDPQLVKTKIAKTFIHDLKSYLLINNKLKTTPEHKIYEKNKGWITAGKLKKGDFLLDTNNQWIKITSLKTVKNPIRVYNLHTKKYHTFFAGNIWVHNGKGGGPITSRDEFLDTAFWKAHIKTNKNGYAHTEVKLPDNTTTWRIIAHAVTQETALGSNTKKIKTNKDILIQPLIPRFLALGDQPTIGMTVHNQTTDQKEIKVDFKSPGLKIEKNHQQNYQLSPNSQKSFYWQTEVKQEKELPLEFSVKNNNQIADQVNLKIPVKTYYTKQTTATSGKVDNYAQEKVEIPENIVADQGSLDLRLSPALGTNIEETTDYLLSYPYQCSEQLASRLLAFANFIRLGENKKLKKINKTSISTLKTNTQAKVYQLTARQNHDGGWGWWQYNDSNPTISALVLESLIEAEKANLNIPQNSLTQGINYLKEELNSGHLDLNEQAFFLSILVQKKPNQFQPTINKLLDQRWQLNKTGRVYLLKTLLLQNQNSQANKLFDQLLSSSIQTNTSAHWETDKEGYSILKSNISLTSLMLQNIIIDNPNNPLADKVARWLINSQKGMRWVNTHNTALVVQGFTKLWLEEDPGRINLNWDFNLNNNKIDSGKFKEFFNTYHKKIELEQLPKNQTLPLEIKKSGNGPLYYNLNYHYYLPYEKVEPEQEGLIVSKQIIDKNGNPVENFVKGKNYWVRLTLITAQEQKYLVLEDKCPAGFQPINNSLATTTRLNQDQPKRSKDKKRIYFKNEEIRDDRVALFAERVHPGVYEYTYKVRALHTGKYHHPAARAYNMYFPDIYGHSAGGWLKIKN